LITTAVPPWMDSPPRSASAWFPTSVQLFNVTTAVGLMKFFRTAPPSPKFSGTPAVPLGAKGCKNKLGPDGARPNLLVAPGFSGLRCRRRPAQEPAMSSAWKAALPLVMVLAAVPAAAAAPAKATPAQIARWVEQLGADEFAARQEASRLLWEAGRDAEEALNRAAHSNDLEVRRRANEVLEKFRWGLYPDTPPELAALVGRYQAGGHDNCQAVVRELLDKGSAGCFIVAKILTAEPSREQRQNLLLVVAHDSPRAYASLLADKEYSTLEKLLEATLSLPLNEGGVQNYAAYGLLRGRLDEYIRAFRDRAEQGNDPEAQTVLAYLYRAKGDPAAVRAAAEKADRQDLVEQALTDQGDWAALARREDVRDSSANLEPFGYRLAFHRLAGDAAGVEKAAADLRAHLGPQPEGPLLWLAARYLFLNDRPADALPLVQRYRKPSVAFEILVVRQQFREALALGEGAAVDDPHERATLDILRARTLYVLGERDRARALFAQVGTGVNGKPGKEHDLLVRTEARLGLKDEALADAARLLLAAPSESRTEEVLGLLFPRRTETARAWWEFLRQRAPDEGPEPILKQVGDLVEGRTTGKAMEALAGEAVRAAARQEPAARERWLLGIADTCRAAGLEPAARDCLEKAAATGTVAAGLRLGDFLAEMQQWAQAAARYEAAWQKDRANPLPLYLQGWALARGGDERAGRHFMDLAHEIPLGDEVVRLEFATELQRRGRPDDARRERQVLVAVSKPLSFAAGEALRDTSVEAIAVRDYRKAADLQERALLRLLEPETEFIDKSAYVTVPAYLHRLRALGLAAAGRGDEAYREADLALQSLPGNVDLTVQLVPALDRLGKKKEADDVFDRVRALQQRLCADYPRAAFLHNNLAWTAARCRRHLDDALEHARTAVKLDPNTPGYRDTLAEVHFQRGERDRALEEMRQCLAQDPKNTYFQKQLKRLEAGDPAADVPGTSDE
jgi:tetratricopeptide (TPR) repeat protein